MLTSLPKTFTAGDQVSWVDNQPVFVGVERAQYAFQNRKTGYRFEINGVRAAGPSTFNFLLETSESSKTAPGKYYWQLFTFDSGGARITEDKGTIGVYPDYSAARVPTQNERILKAINDMLEGVAGDDTASTSINGKSVTSYSKKELTDFHTYFTGLVQQEQRDADLTNGRKSGRDIRVRFNNAS